MRDLFLQATRGMDAGRDAPFAMMVFAHPDDEVIALGARLPRYHFSLIVHITDGAPRNGKDRQDHGFSTLEEYRDCRRKELYRALEISGLESTPRLSFQLPDQEASFSLDQLICSLYRLLILYHPAVIFTHPYEGGHPDHDACAYAVQRAVDKVNASGRPFPMIIEAPFYHLSAQGMETGQFLSPPLKTREICYSLSAEEQQKKQELLSCFRSQREILCHFAFPWECFRIAPPYNFRRPPHRPPVFYDRQPWGMTSERFCELVGAADASKDK